MVRKTVGYHRYDTAAELAALNRIYALQRLLINFFTPQQKLVSKTRHGAKVIKRYDTAATPYQRVLADDRVPAAIKTALTEQYQTLNPAQLRRDVLALSDDLLELVRAKGRPTRLPLPATDVPTRASGREATKSRTRAS